MDDRRHYEFTAWVTEGHLVAEPNLLRELGDLRKRETPLGRGRGVNYLARRIGVIKRELDFVQGQRSTTEGYFRAVLHPVEALAGAADLFGGRTDEDPAID